ncbi:chromate transporter [Lacihabitans soyangensis]|uniref:Chromate transporter n=1 Tax=Lacihabitans soyangensis TaxID=869394 RepID=A0AAE3KUX3_9BACT|nr:chromate transporter [Lacihabitans soyangensis]MCP9765443.1 chromate transporter [Lacihabitans soyangensis]
MKAHYSLSEITLYFLKLGTVGFGGPAALIAYMHRDLVENKSWISEEDYKEGLALAQLAPGPLAAQLAIYLGYVHYRVLGATIVGLAFVIPSFLMVVLLGYLYTLYGGLSWIQAVFYGISAAVIGIIGLSSHKLVTKSIGNDYFLWVIFVITALFTVITESESVWLFFIGGVSYTLYKNPPKFQKTNFIAPLGLSFLGVSASDSDILVKIALFFAKAGAFVFGSGLAIVPFLYAGVVKEYHWLNEKQFLDAVAVAMITPGPVVITVGFIGYLVLGFKGALVAALATFLPCYFFTILPAPYFKKYGGLPRIKSFVSGITAAAVGAISGAVIILGKRSLLDFNTIAIALITVLLLWKYKKIQEPIVILGAAVLGYILKNLAI